MDYYRPQLIEKKSSKELKENIIHELRHIMSHSFSLFESENRIRKIQLSFFELEKRKEGVTKEIDFLEKKTTWKFFMLFEDCIAYPDKSIYPKKYYSDTDLSESVCDICEIHKSELKKSKIKICDSCLKLCNKSLKESHSLENCFIFKTPEVDYWCEHSNENTLLLSTDKYYVKEGIILCQKCIKKEFLIRGNEK